MCVLHSTECSTPMAENKSNMPVEGYKVSASGPFKNLNFGQQLQNEAFLPKYKERE